MFCDLHKATNRTQQPIGYATQRPREVFDYMDDMTQKWARKVWHSYIGFAGSLPDLSSHLFRRWAISMTTAVPASLLLWLIKSRSATSCSSNHKPSTLCAQCTLDRSKAKAVRALSRGLAPFRVLCMYSTVNFSNSHTRKKPQDAIPRVSKKRNFPC